MFSLQQDQMPSFSRATSQGIPSVRCLAFNSRFFIAGLFSKFAVSPSVLINSSLTILTTICAGESDRITSSPMARSRTRARKSLTTLKLTSASSNARRTSRNAASTSASDSLPLPLSFLKTALSFSLRLSNTVRYFSREWGFGQTRTQ